MYNTREKYIFSEKCLVIYNKFIAEKDIFILKMNVEKKTSVSEDRCNLIH